MSNIILYITQWWDDLDEIKINTSLSHLVSQSIVTIHGDATPELEFDRL